MEQNNLTELKEIFKKEGLSWEKLSQKTLKVERSSFRTTFLGWITNVNKVLNEIGYKIEIKPMNDKEKQESNFNKK